MSFKIPQEVRSLFSQWGENLGIRIMYNTYFEHKNKVDPVMVQLTT